MLTGMNSRPSGIVGVRAMRMTSNRDSEKLWHLEKNIAVSEENRRVFSLDVRIAIRSRSCP